MDHSLLLNSDWTPLNFVTSIRALNLIFKGKAELIAVGDDLSVWPDGLTTPNMRYDSPATIRMLRRIPKSWPVPRFRKRVLFNRDRWKCQYCGVDLDLRSITIDHVVPKSRGGQTSWRNCVASCKRCNTVKGSRMLSESGLKLIKQPTDPNVQHFWEVHQVNRQSWHRDWHVFFDTHMY